MKAKKQFFKECHLAGRQYYDVDEVWNELTIGTKLNLEYDEENRYDDNAVAVTYQRKGKNSDGEKFMLGYIPRSDNFEIASLLKMGWEPFVCRISKITPDNHYEDQTASIARLIHISQHKAPENDSSRLYPQGTLDEFRFLCKIPFFASFL